MCVCVCVYGEHKQFFKKHFTNLYQPQTLEWYQIH